MDVSYKQALACCLLAVVCGCGAPKSSNDTAEDSNLSAAGEAKAGGETDATAKSASSASSASQPELDRLDMGNQSAGDASVGTSGSLPTLALPEGLNPQISLIYPSVSRAVASEDPQAWANLAVLSQQIAVDLATANQVDSSIDFFMQSGQALRKALAGGFAEFPESMPATIFVFEAMGLTARDQLDAAVGALDDAFDNGFTRLDLVTESNEFKALWNTDSYIKHLSRWESILAEHFAALVQADLQATKAFPFSFIANDVYGIEQNLESLKGKVVIVDLWGTWCPPCRAEVPVFIELQKRYGDQGLQVIGVNFERASTLAENTKLVTDMIRSLGINYPCLLGTEEIHNQVPEMAVFPTTLFIDRRGTIRLRLDGAREHSYLESAVKFLLAE